MARDVLRKTLKIVGLDGMKCQWVEEQDLLLKFSSRLKDIFLFCFLFFFSNLYNWMGKVLIWVWFERFLLLARVGCQSCLLLKLMTSQAQQEIRTGAYGLRNRPYPIYDAPLPRLARRSFASLQKSRRNHRYCVWTEVPSSMVFVPV